MDAFDKGKARMDSTTSISIPMKSLDSREIEDNFPTQGAIGSASGISDQRFHNDDHAERWVMDPDDKFVRRWYKFFAISCLVAVSVDPLFFFLFRVKQDSKCIVIDSTMKTTLVVLRSITDFIYLLHMLLQICIWFILGNLNISSGANFAKNLLRASILIQYIPRLYRVLPMLVGVSPEDFIFESVWANFVINLLTFVLSGHVVGSCWYLFGFQRVHQCLRDACHYSGIDNCLNFIDCGNGSEAGSSSRRTWNNNVNASACIHGDDNFFKYGIYDRVVNLTTRSTLIPRYVYSFFWGFQQISTLAGNQTPSFFVWEVVFTMAIIVVGLLLFALLIGNMQNYLEAIRRRRLDMLMRHRDFKQGMRHRRLPKKLRKKVRQSERYNWAAMKGGVNELKLLENLPEDLQRDIRQHIFQFVKKIQLFALMPEPVLDAIHKRLRQNTYIKGSRILEHGVRIDKMVFIVRGKLKSIEEDKNIVHLSEGDVCGEELLIWYREHSSVNRDEFQNLKSNRTVKCSTNVEAFILRAADIEEVSKCFPNFFFGSSGSKRH